MFQNPFKGNYLPSRVPIFGIGRPSLPFPHLWNYRTPLRILETFYSGAEFQEGAGKHNRYLQVLGRYRVFVSRDPKVIKAILSTTGDKEGQFDRDTMPSAGIGRATGFDSLLYANGEVWRRQKKLAASSFSRSNLFQPEKFHGFEQTFRKTVRTRLEALRTYLKENNETSYQVALETEIQVVMLEMLVNNFFGGEIEIEEIRNRYIPSITGLIDHMVEDTIAPRLTSVQQMLFGKSREINQAKAAFEELTDIALSGRAENKGLWAQFKSDADNDLLRSNIRVFLAGALEATTSLASWTLYHLSSQPEMQEEIFQEVKDMENYDPENLGQAIELNKAIQETLRLTPSLYFLPRWASEEIEVKIGNDGSLVVPAKTHVLLDVWHSNRCEDFWGKDVSSYPAKEFAPKRWDVLKEKGISPKEVLHFGFGHGPRVCPGKFLGLLEVGLVVGAFTKMFKFSPAVTPVEAKAGVSTKPAGGLLMDIRLRDIS